MSLDSPDLFRFLNVWWPPWLYLLCVSLHDCVSLCVSVGFYQFCWLDKTDLKWMGEWAILRLWLPLPPKLCTLSCSLRWSRCSDTRRGQEVLVHIDMHRYAPGTPGKTKQASLSLQRKEIFTCLPLGMLGKKCSFLCLVILLSVGPGLIWILQAIRFVYLRPSPIRSWALLLSH